jgi:hypothetical protein
VSRGPSLRRLDRSTVTSDAHEEGLLMTAEHPDIVIGRFDDREDARDAMLAIEAKGIDADNINLEAEDALPTADTVHNADRAVVGEVGRHYAEGGLVGAIVGALLGAIALLIGGLGSTSLAIVAGGLTGAIAGFLIGGFLFVGSRLPVNEDTFNTRLVDPAAGKVEVEVRVANEKSIEPVVEAMRAHRARAVERRAA